MLQALSNWLEPISWLKNLRFFLIFVVGFVGGCQSETNRKDWSSIPSPPGNPMTGDGIELGKILFSEPGISGSGKVSCATCHPPNGHFTTNKVDTKRAIPTLYNLAWANSYFWDGSHKNLESLVFRPIFDSIEMHGNLNEFIAGIRNQEIWKKRFHNAFGGDTIYPALISRAISQYIRTIVKTLPNPDSLKANEKKGFEVFKKACQSCHSGKFTSDFVVRKSKVISSGKDLGAYQVSHLSKDSFAFKTPVLIEISKTAPYMHDNRFASLEEVVFQYSKTLNSGELKSPGNQHLLLQFLKKL
jgi:cytochrome c peroxidase